MRLRVLLTILIAALLGLGTLYALIGYQLAEPKFRYQPPPPQARRPLPDPVPTETHWEAFPVIEPALIRDPTARVPVHPTDVSFVIPADFQVELLFQAPREFLGSWICLAVDPRGRLVAGDEEGKGLARITPAPLRTGEPTRVEHLAIQLPPPQGLLFAFGSLYASTTSGLYRVPYDEFSDTFGNPELLTLYSGGPEHGPHGMALSPDGKSLYLVSGNFSPMPIPIQQSSRAQKLGGIRPEVLKARPGSGLRTRVPPNWDEDLLLPRLWDATGHAQEVLSPGGWVAKTDPSGKTWEVVAIGLRNAYDLGFTPAGDLFVHDSNMEWDMGMPWYRPTRLLHVTSGADFGWRSGTGKWPEYYPDSLPAVLQTGPGSPTGILWGGALKFPTRYQQALLSADWTFGRISLLHLQPHGASYSATREEFLSRNGLPITDLAAGADGALYFIVGGRQTQSNLYRVTYTGKESTLLANDPETSAVNHFATQRRVLEETHVADERSNAEREEAVLTGRISLQVESLSHPDRHIRYAARIGLEQQPVELWRNQALALPDPRGSVEAIIALARQGERSDRSQLIQHWLAQPADFGGEELSLAWLRALQLVLVRLGLPDEMERQSCLSRLEPMFPASSHFMNRELVQILIALDSNMVLPKTLDLLAIPSGASSVVSEDILQRNAKYGEEVRRVLDNPPDEQRLHYAFMLRNVHRGWTLDRLVRYQNFLSEARTWNGGTSYRGFLFQIESSFVRRLPPGQRNFVEMRSNHQPPQLDTVPHPKGPGHAWKENEVIAMGRKRITGRSHRNGREMYQAARCASCHRFGSEGGATGPDLTHVSGRFNWQAIAEAIISPSRTIPEQFRNHVLHLADGPVISGRIIIQSSESITLMKDPQNPADLVEVPLKGIESRSVSPVSPMPAGLLNEMNRDEVLDLFAYLISGGDEHNPMFGPERKP